MASFEFEGFFRCWHSPIYIAGDGTGLGPQHYRNRLGAVGGQKIVYEIGIVAIMSINQHGRSLEFGREKAHVTEGSVESP